MSNRTRISLREVSAYSRVDVAVMLEWADFGLYQTIGDDDPAIEIQTIDRLKRIIGLHQALGINKEGIEVILGLTQQIADLQKEAETLRVAISRLRSGWDAEPMETLRSRGLLVEFED